MNSIGQRIKEIRIARGLSQRALAEAVGVSVQAVSQWEKGKSGLSIDSMQAISKHLSCDLQWLMVGHKSEKLYVATGEELSVIPVIDMSQAVSFINSFKPKTEVLSPFEVLSSTEFKGESFALHIFDDEYSDYINKGDLLIFDTGETPVTGDIVLASMIEGNETSEILNENDRRMLLNTSLWLIDEKVDPKVPSKNHQVFKRIRKADYGKPGSRHTGFVIGVMVERRTYSRRTATEITNLKSYLTVP